MSNSVVNLLVNDSGYNAKIKQAASTFAGYVSQVGGAKSQYGALTKAIQQSTIAQEALNAVMSKNPMGAVIAVATAAATTLMESLNGVSEEQQRLADAAEERAERERHENETVVNSVADIITKYQLLRNEWQSLSNEHSKSQWLKENKSKFQQLGIAVNDVKTAEDVFVNNTQKVVAALIARAKAEAYGELYKEKLKKKITNDLNPSVDNGRQYVKQNRLKRSVDDEKLAGVTPEDINWKRETVMKNGIASTNTTFGSYKQSGLDKLNKLRNDMALARKAQEENELNMLAQNMAIFRGESDNILDSAGLIPVRGGSGGGKGGRGGRSGSKVAKEQYVPAEGTPDYISAMIKELQTKLGKTVDQGERMGILQDIESLKEELKTMTTLPDIGGQLKDEFEPALSPLQQLNEELKELRSELEMSPNAEAYQENLQKIADKEKEIANFKGIKEAAQDSKSATSDFSEAATAIGRVGSAMASIEDPTAKVMGIVAQAIATVAAAYASALGSDTTTKGNIWAFIAAAAAATVSMVTTIASIHSATGFALGGMVEGNSYSSDQIPIMANAGEVVLTRAMQGNLASQLQGNQGNLNLTATITGEQIRLALNNNGRRTGRGEFVQTTNM